MQLKNGCEDIDHIRYYPAVVSPDEDGYIVKFPDLPYGTTLGKDADEVVNMAEEVLWLVMEDYVEKGNYPKPSPISDIKLKKGEYLVKIGFNESEYKREHSEALVKKTLTIPEYLNNAAIARGINFSALLRSALEQELKTS